MRKWLLHIIYIGILGSIAVACSNENLILDSVDKEHIQVTFTLSMSSPVTSRATESWGNNTNSALDEDAYDNRIETDRLQVLFYDDNTNTCLGKVEDIVVFRTESENIYQFMGSVNIENAIDYTLPSCKVMVFANTDEVTTGTDLTNLTFDFSKNKSMNIPMWGVASFTNLRLAPGTHTDLKTIYLLRAMAKVKVELSSKLADKYELKEVKLEDYNTRGYSLPKSYAEIDNTTSLDILQGFNPLDSRASQPYVFSKKEDGSYIAYMPECDNTSQRATPAKIKVTLNDKEYTIDFKDYNNGGNTFFDVIRNHYYSFEITKIGEDAVGLSFQYQVIDWTSIDNGTLNFGNGNGSVTK